MDLRDAFALTGASIRTHKLRSVLAAIGVVLGIGSVIGIVTMGAGFQESILGSFTEQFSADLLSVGVEQPGQERGPPTSTSVFAFTDRDLAALESLPHVKELTATTPVPQATLTLEGKDFPGVVVNARHGSSEFSSLESGRAATSEFEAVASNTTAAHLRAALNRTDVLGTTLTVTWPNPAGGVQSHDVTLVGVRKASTFFAQETLSVGGAFAPPATYNGTATHLWESVAIRADASANVGAVKAAAKDYLESQSDAKTRKGERLVFRFDTQADVIALINNAIAQFTGFIGALGAVALLVGLVGIANIMLVSVQERTREIGVMKATGATRGEILLVFLVESVAICVVGAILGIGLGMLMGLGLNAVVGAFSTPRTDVPFILVWRWYAIAVALGVLTGLVAGLYPAWRAGKVSPVEALRYE